MHCFLLSSLIGFCIHIQDLLWDVMVMAVLFGTYQVIAASGAVKHEDIVEQVKKLFTKLSSDPTTATQLVAKEPAIFTGSEVGKIYLEYTIISSHAQKPIFV